MRKSDEVILLKNNQKNELKNQSELNFHFMIGFFSFLFFLFTGIYMKIGFPDLYGGDEVKRLLFRTNHLIFFWFFYSFKFDRSDPSKKSSLAFFFLKLGLFNGWLF